MAKRVYQAFSLLGISALVRKLVSSDTQTYCYWTSSNMKGVDSGFFNHQTFAPKCFEFEQSASKKLTSDEQTKVGRPVSVTWESGWWPNNSLGRLNYRPRATYLGRSLVDSTRWPAANHLCLGRSVHRGPSLITFAFIVTHLLLFCI